MLESKIDNLDSLIYNRWWHPSPNWERMTPNFWKVFSTLQMNRRLTDDPNMTPFVSRRNELLFLNGCIMWGSRVVMPVQLQPHILEKVHAAHLGIVKMKAVARIFVWWPRIDSDTDKLATSFENCQIASVSPAKASIHPWLCPSGPLQRIHGDLTGPFKSCMFLIVCDAYSKCEKKWIKPLNLPKSMLCMKYSAD